MQTKKFKINFGLVSFIMVVVFAVLLATDLITKTCEESFNWNFNVLRGLIYVESGNRNPGAAFSFLANADWGQTFLIIVTFVMLIALIAFFIYLPERFVLLKLALAMIISGAVGNLVDRIAFSEVRDFVWVNMLGKWACCNFADFWIVFGIIIAIVDMLFFNEWSVFPLTKKAKAAQAERKRQEQSEGGADNSDDVTEISTTSEQDNIEDKKDDKE
jgi:signal peptidase II